MGGWIWNDTIERLGRRGAVAHTLTLSGLEAGTSGTELGDVRLADHVGDVVRAARAIDQPLVVVGHSYSGIIAGMVADQLPDRVMQTVIVAGFFPRDGRSLLDDWGSSADERAAERADIEEAGMIWAPPPLAGVEADAGLDATQAAWLGERLVPHPGRTILDAASMQQPISERSVVVIADVGDGDPRATLPDDLENADLDHWRFRSIPVGHWPMLSCPDELDEALLEAAANGWTTADRRYQREYP